jgi:hypothetical protein
VSRAEDRLGCLWGGLVVVLALVGWMVATNAAAPRHMALLKTGLADLGYEVTEAYPGVRGPKTCPRHVTQFVWKTAEHEGEACVYRDGIEVLYVRPRR